MAFFFTRRGGWGEIGSRMRRGQGGIMAEMGGVRGRESQGVKGGGRFGLGAFFVFFLVSSFSLMA